MTERIRLRGGRRPAEPRHPVHVRYSDRVNPNNWESLVPDPRPPSRAYVRRAFFLFDGFFDFAVRAADDFPAPLADVRFDLLFPNALSQPAAYF